MILPTRYWQAKGATKLCYPNPPLDAVVWDAYAPRLRDLWLCAYRHYCHRRNAWVVAVQAVWVCVKERSRALHAQVRSRRYTHAAGGAE